MYPSSSSTIVNTSTRLLRPNIIPHTPFRPVYSKPLIKATGQKRMFALSAHRRDQPKTFSNQDRLPRLPVPDLEKSLEGYLKSLGPVLEQTYGASALPNEIEKRKLFAKDFAAPGGLGRVLQERLKDLDHVSPNNWLNDTLWLGLAYHTWRAPLLVNSNWWLLFAPDPSDPAPPAQESKNGKFDGSVDWEKVVRREWITEWQVRKAAWLARRFAEFRTKLLKEEILPDSSKAGPFDMHQYSRMFNLSRIPLPNSDAFSAIDNKATHITLMIDDYIYSIDIFSPPSIDGVPEPLSPSDTEQRFKAAVDDAKRRKDSGEKAEQIGILTADERDNWTKNREHLLLLSLNNRQTFNSISSSLIVLSLDPYTLPSIPSDDPLKLPSVDASVRNTASGIDGARNRWFDKAVSVMVETNGRAGIMGEHSPVDALIPSIVGEYVLASPVDQSQFTFGSGSSSAQGWKKLDWVVDEEIHKEIEGCKERNQKLIDDSDASQLWWNEYGAEWIKSVAKQSPDAYIQQALQLAWYKDQGYATATYETASTRMMLHGRTDVIRSLSSESRNFVKSMLDDQSDDAKRYSLLTDACKAHNHLTRQSSQGNGYDRHLMGLKVHLRGDESHPIFDDEVYAKSQEWKLSTSGLSAGGKFMGTGFGAAWPDGYGINYLAGPYLVKFGIESKFSCDKTSTQRFKHNIVQALRDMRRVCEAAADAGESKARL
uniref:Carnitine acetyltransferase n=1 Tax=Kwoniella bestiolae CBS 10118 TaxID=1296100 RepID=A0A1B9FUD9_9TREE|nr:carnitine acetyltransferase [Kwoniella bestiolae CBS 10118]OCF22377.1 carnitine acetyltransferase [Kwoniella bestiolae CBS 10118]